MIRLTREVRFSLAEFDGPVLNTWAGWPTTESIDPFLILRMTVEGEIDPKSGYLCNIRDLDQIVRREAIPFLLRAHTSADPPAPPATMVSELSKRLALYIPTHVRLSGLELRLTPFLRYAIHQEVPDMVQLTQSFEFSAAHRLYSKSLSAEENLALFGKCANANGHGHNYVVEVTISESVTAAGRVLPLAKLEQVVKSKVVDRFDHKHLNLDCPEFAELNPTVEHITQVIWRLLVQEVSPAKLACVRVWETPKTCAEFRG